MARWTAGTGGRCQRGSVLLLTMIFLVLFASLAIAFHSAVGMNLQQSKNYTHAQEAQMAAESGMEFMLNRVRNVIIPGVEFEADPLLSVANGLAAVMDGTGNLGAGEVWIDQDGITIPCIPVTNGQSFSATLADVSADEIELVVTGQAGGVTRSLAMRLGVVENRQLLHYAVASSVRIIARGNIRVHGPVVSSWGREFYDGGPRNRHVFPLDIELGSNGFIEGGVGTTLSQQDFTGYSELGDTDFHDGMTSDNPDYDPLDDIQYNEPPAMELKVEDFDTSPLRAMTDVANLPAADLNGNKWVGHDGDGKPALNNVRVPKGTNPVFENCKFTGIIYIEVDEQTDCPSSSNQNRVTFKNCTFEGPIITGVPKKMDWNKNRMDFEGDTFFDGEMIQQALGGVTLMAPNYNVNIGDCNQQGVDSVSEIVGLVIGGCVDLRDKVRVHGTVVSMAEICDEDGNIIMGQSASWLTGTGVCGANLGNQSDGSEGGGDESNNDIDIWPNPDNVMPLGIKKKYSLCAIPDSYREL